ncbi:MAG: substrate-binding domain-containing protein [Opitutales bacterium]|nr:substrate-binding domain-containing protein [Opitutales bacterium]
MSFSTASFILKRTCLAAALLTAGTLATLAETPVRYSGSDFLSGEPEKALNAHIEKNYGEAPTSKLRGSIAGEKELRGGKADFALLMLPAAGKNIPEVKAGEWRVFPLGYQVAYVAAASANPLNEITFEQLASIFGNFSKTEAKSWEELGAAGFSPSITPCSGDLSKTNAVTFFQRKVLPNFAFRPSVRNLASDENAFKEIINNPGAIAIVGKQMPAGVPIKLLAVADNHENENATAYAPIFTNIYNGDYPLTIPVYVVYPTKNRLMLKSVLSYLYSQEMADQLADAGFLPLEPKLREQFQKGIDNIK